MAEDRIGKLRKLRQQREAGGGAEAAAKQHEAGKLTARERLDQLFDAGTFQEKGLFAEHRCVDFGLAGRELPADARSTPADSRRLGATSEDVPLA